MNGFDCGNNCGQPPPVSRTCGTTSLFSYLCRRAVPKTYSTLIWELTTDVQNDIPVNLTELNE